MRPYVYKLTHKLTGQFYIGYRCRNELPASEDLPIYQSSSKLVKELGFDNFDCLILAEFFDRNSAYDFEQETICEHWGHPDLLNRHCVHNGKNRFLNPGGPPSQEKRDRLREVNLGKKASEETKAKMRASAKGVPKSKEHCEAVSRAKKGSTYQKHTKPMSEETRIKRLAIAQSEEYRNKLRVAQQARRQREKDKC